MTDSVYQKVGAVVLPAEAGDVPAAATLDSLDPVNATFLALLSAAITAELSGAWGVISASLPTGHVLRGTTPVESSLAHEPTRELMQQRKATCPALFVYRTPEWTYEQESLYWWQRVQTWRAEYLLGPSDLAPYLKGRKMIEALVPAVIQTTLCRCQHPAYDSGYRQFGDGEVRDLVLVSAKAGIAAFAETTDTYHAVSVDFQTRERVDFVPGADAPLQGASFRFDVGGAAGTFPGLIYADGSEPYQQG